MGVPPQGFSKIYSYKYKATGTVDEDPPTQNTWYTVLDTTDDVRLIGVTTRQINDETDTKTIAVRITIDGVTLETGNVTCNNNSFYYVYHQLVSDSIFSTTNARNIGFNTGLRGQSVKVEVRQTEATGTNQQLDGRAVYETLEPT